MDSGSTTSLSPAGIGALVRMWRQRKRLTQMECAMDAGISARHLSFIETGRSVPSRDMVLRLAESLQVPLRERDTLLLATGLAPMFRESSFDDPDLKVARRAVDAILTGLEPNP